MTAAVLGDRNEPVIVLHSTGSDLAMCHRVSCKPEGVFRCAPMETLVRMRAFRNGGHRLSALQGAALHITDRVKTHMSDVSTGVEAKHLQNEDNLESRPHHSWGGA